MCSQTKLDGKIQSLGGCLITLWIFPSLSNLIQIIGKDLAILMTQPGTELLILPASPSCIHFPSHIYHTPALNSANHRPCLSILLLLVKSDEEIELLEYSINIFFCSYFLVLYLGVPKAQHAKDSFNNRMTVHVKLFFLNQQV